MTTCREAWQISRQLWKTPAAERQQSLCQACLTPGEAGLAPRQENSEAEAGKTEYTVAQGSPTCPSPSWAPHSAPSTSGAAVQPWDGVSIQGLTMPVMSPRVSPVTLTRPLQHLTLLQNTLRTHKVGTRLLCNPIPPAAPSTGYSHCGNPAGSGAVGQVLGGSWGDPTLAKHRSPERGLQSLSSLGQLGERPGTPGAPPRSPLPPSRGCGPISGPHTAKGDAATLRGYPRLPLTTEYP